MLFELLVLVCCLHFRLVGGCWRAFFRTCLILLLCAGFCWFCVYVQRDYVGIVVWVFGGVLLPGIVSRVCGLLVCGFRLSRFWWFCLLWLVVMFVFNSVVVCFSFFVVLVFVLMCSCSDFSWLVSGLVDLVFVVCFCGLVGWGGLLFLHVDLVGNFLLVYRGFVGIWWLWFTRVGLDLCWMVMLAVLVLWFCGFWR